MAGLSLSERPLFGRAVLKGGEEVRMKFFFPPMQGKEKPGPLKKEEILVEVAEVPHQSCMVGFIRKNI